MTTKSIAQESKLPQDSPKQNVNCRLRVIRANRFLPGDIEGRLDFIIRQQAEGQLRSDYERLVVVALGPQLSEYLDTWVEGYKTRTGNDYKSLIEKHIKPGLGHYKLRELTRDIIQHWIDEVKSVKKVGNDGQPLDLSSVTKRHIIRCLHKALEDAIPTKLDHNPANKVIVHQDDDEEDEGKVNTLTQEEDNILLAATHIPYYDHIALARWTGLRRGEELALRRRDYGHDRDDKPILGIGGSYNEKTHRYKSTKNRRRRIIHLWPQADEIIKRQLLSPGKPDDYLFPGKLKGLPLYPTTLTHNFSKGLRLLGLPHHRFHDLRHTFACWLFNHEGWNLIDVQAVPGSQGPDDYLEKVLGPHHSESAAPTHRPKLSESTGLDHRFRA
jgi:integrase